MLNCAGACELIDTCWDVNIISLSFNNRWLRINRYMLGCKWFSCIDALIPFIELIDTCWDVNLHDKDVNPTGEAELIDTCWDVNIKKGHSLDYTL